MRNGLALVGTILVLAASYGLARAGEPSSRWFWCGALMACR